MKKLKSTILFILLFAMLLTSVSFAEPIKVNLNGNQLSLPVDPI